MNYALYIHIPFCRHRCAYCDFNTYAGQEAALPAYVEAVCKEIAFLGQNAPERLVLGSVFFGGGTPSLLQVDQFEAILRAVREAFDLEAPEITVEANPGTVTRDGLRDLRALGINRISFGVQSIHPEELRLLERQHDTFDVIDAVRWSRWAGFDNLSLDLIYGLPSQSLLDWSASVRLASDLHPEHLSLYCLTLEHSTPFGRWAAHGLLPLPDPDLAAEMYEWAGTALAGAGYEHYEISNWAQPDRQCRHNLQYWRALPYLGVGAGSHGYAAGYRYSNALRIRTYIDRLSGGASWELPFPFSPANVDRHHQSAQDEMGEFMMTGLRLTVEGVSDGAFKARYGSTLEQVYSREIEELLQLRLLEWQGDRLRLTPRGRLVGNQVFMRFV